MNKCPVCVEQDTKSKLYVSLGGIVTDMLGIDYYDEDGNYHSHDPNWRTVEWDCSNGHSGSFSTRGGCGICKDREVEVHVDVAKSATA